MTGRGRRVLLLVATFSPFWVFGCGDAPPPLEFLPGRPSPSQLYPTGTPVYVTVSAPSRPVGNCTSSVSGFHELTLIEASCGDGCTVEDTGIEDIERPGSLRLALTAPTAGWRTLEVRVHDEREGVRGDAVELEFANLGQLEVGHWASTDPGVAAAMLVGLTPHWEVRASATDGRALDLQASGSQVEVLNDSLAVQSVSTTGNEMDAEFTAAAPGMAHVQIFAAGARVEYFPVVVAEEDIVSVHLHGLLSYGEAFQVPMDEEGYWQGPEQPLIVPTEADFPLDLLIRLVTAEGLVARGGANRFRTDHSAVEATWPGTGDDGQVLRLVLRGSNPPPATCVRATIGSGSVALPVYIDRQPGDVPDPCLSPLGGGGAGGAPP